MTSDFISIQSSFTRAVAGVGESRGDVLCGRENIPEEEEASACWAAPSACSVSSSLGSDPTRLSGGEGEGGALLLLLLGLLVGELLLLLLLVLLVLLVGVGLLAFKATGVDCALFFWPASNVPMAPFCLFCSRRKRSLYRFTSRGSSSPFTSWMTERISLMPERPVGGMTPVPPMLAVS